VKLLKQTSWTPKKVDALSDVKCLRVSCGLSHTGVVTGIS